MNHFSGVCIFCLSKMLPSTHWIEKPNKLELNYICKCGTCFCISGEIANFSNTSIEIFYNSLKGSWIIPKTEHTKEIWEEE